MMSPEGFKFSKKTAAECLTGLENGAYYQSFVVKTDRRARCKLEIYLICGCLTTAGVLLVRFLRHLITVSYIHQTELFINFLRTMRLHLQQYNLEFTCN